MSRQDYAALYSAQEDPWNYSRRAAEILRHELIARELAASGVKFENALDVGCGLGQLTRRLKSLTRNLTACDVSEPALKKARGMEWNRGVHFTAAGLPGLPFRKESFDLVVAADGINEFVPEPSRPQALSEIRAALKAGGLILFSDYMRPGSFEPFIRAVGDQFRILKLVYLNDRMWYQFESWFKAVRHWEAVKILLSQVWIARILRPVSGLLGTKGSTHLLILAQKT